MQAFVQAQNTNEHENKPGVEKNNKLSVKSICSFLQNMSCLLCSPSWLSVRFHKFLSAFSEIYLQGMNYNYMLTEFTC